GAIAKEAGHLERRVGASEREGRVHPRREHPLIAAARQCERVELGLAVERQWLEGLQGRLEGEEIVAVLWKHVVGDDVYGGRISRDCTAQRHRPANADEPALGAGRGRGG